MASLQLTLLGGFRACSARGEELELSRRKAMLLLACLALRPGEPQTREKMIGLLWSDRGDAQARGSLRQALTTLRKTLNGMTPPPLVISGEKLWLDPLAVDVDVGRFEMLVRSDEPDDLEQAAGLYSGAFLDGITVRDAEGEQWLSGERERLHELLLGALERLLKQQMQAGADDRAVATAERILVHDSLREVAHRALMRLHARQGRCNLALRQYRQCQELLSRELDVQPEPETQKLYEEIQRQRSVSPTQPTVSEVRPTAPADSQISLTIGTTTASVAADRPNAGGAAADEPSPARPAIAVLPFLNLSDDLGQQYFSDGVTEDIITELSRFRSLLVIARNSAFQYRDKAVDVRAVARELGVQYVVEGSVRRVGDRIRISAQLIDAASANHLWAERYDRDLQNLFAVQDDVTQTVVATIEGRVAAGAAARARRKPTEHMDAYDYVLQARDHMARYDLVAAEPLLARAMSADPAYAEAYARHAFIIMFRYWADQDADHLNRGRTQAQKALALDPDDEWAHFAMGSVYLSLRQFDLAGSHYERVLALNPNNVSAATMYAEWLTYVGRPDEALQRLDDSMRRDPFPPGWYWETRGQTLFQLKQYEDAVKAFSSMTILHPWNHTYLAAAYAHAGCLAHAGRQLARHAAGSGPSLIDLAAAEPYKDGEAAEHLIDGLRKAASVAPMPDDHSRRPAAASLPAAASALAPEADTAGATGSATAKPSIAVLPFTNIGDDPDQEYFADGLTEDIITDLSQVSGLLVVARHTVFTFKGRPVRLQDVARELNVRYLLEGCVRKVGERVRITTQLVDGTTGGYIWAHRYDRSADDIIALQDEISKSIVDVLKVRLLPGELETITHRATVSAAAYEYYLIGRSFYMRGIDRRSLTIARGLFAKALELDPNYARAHAGAAICDSYLTMSDTSASFASALAKVSRALELDPSLAEAYAVKGMVLFAVGRYDDATVEFERALKLGPGLFEAHFFYARSCRLQGRHAEAATLFAHAAELRPQDFRSMGLLAEQYKTLCRRDDFLSAARRCLERLAAELAAHADNADAWAFGSAILAQIDEKACAENWAVRALVIGPDDYMVRYNVSRTYAMLGKTDSALDHLEGAFGALPEFQRRLAAWMKLDEEIAPLRSHARFQALAQRLDAAARGTVPAPGSDRPAIAVLPFRSISGDQEEESFADGLAENITADLSQVSAFSVAARHAVFAFKGKQIPVQQIAGELRVGYVLEGSILKAGARVRIATVLNDGATGEQLWARRYDRPLDDIFALQDEIAKSIVEVLKVKLLPGELEAMASRPTANAQAYEYYLTARSFYLRGIDKHSLRIARQMFARASEIDPGYARAYAGMAVCDFYLAMSDPDGSFEGAVANAARALELEPNLAEAHAAKGLTFYAVGRYVAASAQFERALSCDPNSFEAHFLYARNCRLQGLHREAAALFERAAELRPNDFRSLGLLAVAYRSLGRRADSLVAARRCLQRVEAEIELHPDNADALAFGSALSAELGDEARAEDWAARALMTGPDDYLVQYNVARTYALLGKFDDALPRLQRAFGTSPACRHRLAEWMRQDEKLEPLRADPRFQAFAERLASEPGAQA